MAQQYEVEIKSLLDGEDGAKALLRQMHAIDPSISCLAKHRQLNHYFTGADLRGLVQNLAPLFEHEAQARLSDIATGAQEYSVRTRNANDLTLFIVKASIDDTTSANGVSRIEFEEAAPVSFNALDRLVLDAGFSYQAKWSREREEYVVRGVNVCLDKNAGYGYLAEFEKIVHAQDAVPAARDEVRSLMAELNVEELPQDRLARMFAFYNENWSNYYGTDKIFIVE